MPTLTQVEHTTILEQTEFLTKTAHDDLYAISPSYFGVTGRRGLWVYQDATTSMIICLHPNEPNTVLMFPPFGPSKERLIESVLAEDAFIGCAVKFARVTPSYVSIAEKFGTIGVEKELDWKFPSYSVDPFLVSGKGGSKLSSFRNKVNKAQNTEKLATRMIDFAVDAADIEEIAEKWALGRTGGTEDLSDLIDPTLAAIRLSKNVPLSGLFLLNSSDQPIGYAIWERTRPQERRATGLLSQISERIDGASEFMKLHQCEILANEQYFELCIGGSETQELDRYKRKFYPTRRITLKTATIR